MSVMTAAAQARGLPFGRPLTRDDLPRVPYNGKCELFDGTLVVTREGYPFTRAELEATPDDGHRYEIIDGLLVVTPAPDSDHQGMLGKLYSLMTAACPPDLRVYFAPFDVELTARAITQPDLLVTRRSDVRRRGITVAPLLTVEILSPSTRHIDLGLKRSQYEEAGCPSYWVIDPRKPSIMALELRDGAYVEVGRASGEESLTLTLPFPVTVVPARLLD